MQSAEDVTGPRPVQRSKSVFVLCFVIEARLVLDVNHEIVLSRAPLRGLLEMSDSARRFVQVPVAVTAKIWMASLPPAHHLAHSGTLETYGLPLVAQV